jgi:hypothetical protein
MPMNIIIEDFNDSVSIGHFIRSCPAKDGGIHFIGRAPKNDCPYLTEHVISTENQIHDLYRRKKRRIRTLPQY